MDRCVDGWMDDAYMVGYMDCYGDAWMDIVYIVCR